jgi:hypothetical protein
MSGIDCMDLTVQNLHPLQWIQITKHKGQDMVGDMCIPFSQRKPKLTIPFDGWVKLSKE